jgi:S-formylglutathione hydrolase FrmB
VDIDGKHERIRAKDSIHLTEKGGELMVAALLKTPGGIGIAGLPAVPYVPEELPVEDILAGLNHIKDQKIRVKDTSNIKSTDAFMRAGLNEIGAYLNLAQNEEPKDAPSAGTEDRIINVKSYNNPTQDPILPNNTATLMEINLSSKALGKDTSYFVYLPNPEIKAPTIILLHGAQDSGGVWEEKIGRSLFALADELGVNLVMPDGGPFGWYLDSPYKKHSQYEEYIIKELIPDLNNRFLPDNARMGITGISMGGHGALTLSLKNKGLFKAVGSLSGVTDIASHGQKGKLNDWLKLRDILGPYDQETALWQSHSAYHLTRRNPEILKDSSLFLAVGLSDNLVLAENRQYARLLKDMGIPHEYDELSGSHSWDLWKSILPKHLTKMADALLDGKVRHIALP